MEQEIKIKGAKVHNLKNISLSIPHGKLVIITGLSGSGKSTLAFDTLFAEGQRRYVESLSSYARQFLGKIEKPDVEQITGLAPAIAVEQKVNTRNPRSTVGTTTEIYDYLRLLFARIGKTISPVSHKEVKSHTTEDVLNYILKQPEQTRLLVAAPNNITANQTPIEKLTLILKDGGSQIVQNGEIVDIEDFIQSDNTDLKWSLLIGRIITSKDPDADEQTRLMDTISKAFAMGKGECEILDTKGNTKSFSTRFELDGIEFERPTDHLFSFNNPIGACPKCEGYGKVVGIDEDLVIPDKSKTIFDNAIACWRGESMSKWKEQLILAGPKSGISIHKPFYEFTRKEKLLIWSGNKYFEGLDAFFKMLEQGKYKIQYRVMLSRYTGKSMCPDCGGSRLRKEAEYVLVGNKNMADIVFMPINELQEFFAQLKLDKHDKKIADRILIEITSRLQYLMDVGLSYLHLDRQSSTLSGGESQRINLATSLGSSLVGSLYILDEPSIGLHPRDTERLIGVLKQLRDIGNTVIVVEHDAEIMRASDVIIDIGPDAGRFGGEVVYNGPIAGIETAQNSLTAKYLLGIEKIEPPKNPRVWNNFIEVIGARHNNLRNINVKIPLGVFTCITGVSGSGKSSLVGNIIYPALRREILDLGGSLGDFDEIRGDLNKISSVELVDQNPIGKSLRSNPVTYIKAYDDIRKIFASQPQAKAMGYDPSSFSFNIAGGRCEECKGEGIIHVEMQFMANVELLCEHCEGKRFKDNILNVKYKDKSIHDILEMSISEAIDFFGTQANDGDKMADKVVEKLGVLADVGLRYIKLGQSSSTLSGGESQRVKLASFLLKENSRKPILFIFDEPTTGLHFHDIKKLLKSFDSLINAGHTVVVIEHNMDVVKCSDWVIDLGPGGGKDGGQLVFEGTPRELAKANVGCTAEYLKPLF